MHFLVTGGAGFIGSHLVGRLLAEGHAVTVLDDFSTGLKSNLDPHSGKFTLVEGSVVDPRCCVDATRDVDVVLHQAALGSVSRSVEDPIATHAANATGTLTLLVAARKAGVRRFVYAASSSAYGNTTELPKHEGMVPLPLSPYAVTKLAGENYLHAFATTYGLSTMSLRYFNVFGPNQNPHSEYAAVIPRFVVCALAGRAPTIFDDGQQTRDFTYVDNVVEANLRAAVSTATGTVNVGSGTRISLNTLWKEIQALTGVVVDAEHLSARRGDVRDSQASLTLAEQKLGYRPVVDFREGLGRTVEWFRAARQSAAGTET